MSAVITAVFGGAALAMALRCVFAVRRCIAKIDDIIEFMDQAA